MSGNEMSSKRMHQQIRNTCGAALLAALAGCTQPLSTAPIEGRWLQPVPGQQGALQGIDIEERGIASSVNMKTLVYRSWTLRDGKLTLSGTSIGNRQAIPFTQTYRVAKLTQDALVLKQNGETQAYRRARLPRAK